MPRPITEPLYYINTLRPQILHRGDADLQELTFLTFSAKEIQTPYKTLYLVPGPQKEETLLLREDEEGVELYPKGNYPIFLPTRRWLVVDWNEVPEDSRPQASLTWLIGKYSNGQAVKLAEITHGAITAATFKFLQVEGVNYLLKKLTQATKGQNNAEEQD